MLSSTSYSDDKPRTGLGGGELKLHSLKRLKSSGRVSVPIRSEGLCWSGL